MKKLVVLIILVIASGKSYSQETLHTILDSLSINDKTVRIKKLHKGKAYFEYLSNGDDFLMPKNERTCCNLLIFKISTYKHFSLYCILNNDADDRLNKSFDEVMLYDNNSGRCFVIEYGFEKNIIKLKENTFLLNNNFSKRICEIVEVDTDLKPVASLSVEYMENDNIYSYNRYFFDNSGCSKRKMIFEEQQSFKNLTYQDFLDLSLEDKTSLKTECSRDDSFIFYRFAQ